MKLVVVESPAKAKTINKYLGSDYKVEASYGHICDLPSKNGSVDIEKDFEMKYEISPRSIAHIKKLSEIASKSDELILATDPDREGEAISWHVVRALHEKKALKSGTKISRVAFNEITKKAVNDAISNPREIDQDLVDAQQARRALDYLVGFNLSPVLWRKLPGAKSAGRVQSVALKLICERENEIEQFKTEEYWDIIAKFSGLSKKQFSAKLVVSGGEKLEKFSIPNSLLAEDIVKKLKDIDSFFVFSIEKKLQKRNPPAPFTTSTLQQEASRKLGFSTKKTMQLAQKLYEGVEIDSESLGLITYMRTDGVYISEEAISQTREYIAKNLGNEYLPSAPRKYKSKDKNAQEAHEAIRPTNVKLTPQSIESQIEKDLYKLYDLIWKRTIACQAESAELELVAVEIGSQDKQYIFKANGSILRFDGFYKIYQEGQDDTEDDGNEKILPPIEENEKLNCHEIQSFQHFTEPPPRFNEASLVKKLEELGIGRPSTYAAIISVIQDREYVKLEKKRFIPEERGRLVTAFLNEFFSKYVEYDFTAQLEEELDLVADGKIGWKNLLHKFWDGFNKNVEDTSQIKITEIIEKLEKNLEYHLFPTKNENDNPKKCRSCETGTLGLRIGKYGAFIACSNYPECNYKQTIQSSGNNEDTNTETQNANNKLLGELNGKNIFLKKGPYGFYIEQEEQDKVLKPKRVSLPPFLKPDDVNLSHASNLLSLPISLGQNSDGAEVSVGIGKFGPYIKCDNKFTSIPKSEDPFAIDLSRALEIVEQAAKFKKKT